MTELHSWRNGPKGIGMCHCRKEGALGNRPEEQQLQVRGRHCSWEVERSAFSQASKSPGSFPFPSSWVRAEERRDLKEEAWRGCGNTPKTQLLGFRGVSGSISHVHDKWSHGWCCPVLSASDSLVILLKGKQDSPCEWTRDSQNVAWDTPGFLNQWL